MKVINDVSFQYTIWFYLIYLEVYLKNCSHIKKIYHMQFIDTVWCHMLKWLLTTFSNTNNVTSRFLIRHKPAWLNGYLVASVLHTCSRSTILLAKGGVNCHTCWRVRPSMSNMSTAPATCVSGSSMATSRNSTQPLYTSSRETLLCFHFSAHTRTHTTMILLAPLHIYLWLLFSETCPSGGHRILVGRQWGRERSTLNQIVQIYVTDTPILFLSYF